MYSLFLCCSAILCVREGYILSYCGRIARLLWQVTKFCGFTWPLLTCSAAVYRRAPLSSCCSGPATLHEAWCSSSWPGISCCMCSTRLHSPDSLYPSSPWTFYLYKKKRNLSGNTPHSLTVSVCGNWGGKAMKSIPVTWWPCCASSQHLWWILVVWLWTMMLSYQGTCFSYDRSIFVPVDRWWKKFKFVLNKSRKDKILHK